MNTVPMVAHVPDYDYDVVIEADAPTHSTRRSPTHAHACARVSRGGSKFSAKALLAEKNQNRTPHPLGTGWGVKYK